MPGFWTKTSCDWICERCGKNLMVSIIETTCTNRFWVKEWYFSNIWRDVSFGLCVLAYVFICDVQIDLTVYYVNCQTSLAVYYTKIMLHLQYNNNFIYSIRNYNKLYHFGTNHHDMKSESRNVSQKKWEINSSHQSITITTKLNVFIMTLCVVVLRLYSRKNLC